ncbi:MAG TPA: hemerythrin domain-containing protein [Clostridia bacterium]|nr:hemerythrin domain-containing protein [Clostridia bacterium]
MHNLAALKRQHQDIVVLIDTIENLIEQKNIEENASIISKYINELSGKLKIHLSHEDQYLYPNFKKSKHENLRNKVENYINEMGDLSEIFYCYKNSFNTRTKILKEPNEFIRESEIIFFAIKKRISREDDDLYVLAENI